MKKTLSILCCLFFMSPLIAVENQPAMTVNDLLNDGYSKMTTSQVRQQLLGKTLTVLDLQAGSQYETTLLKQGERVLKKTKAEHPSSLTDADYHSRAALLTGKASFSFKNNKILSTDGVRTYTILLYQKGTSIYGTRNVDSDRIYFQIKIKH